MATPLTTDWYKIQDTHVYEHAPVSSDVHNRLLKAFGKGKQWVVRGFGDIEIFGETIVPGVFPTRVDALIARFNPGIAVHDYTVLDYIGAMKRENIDPLKIVIKCFDTTIALGVGCVFDIGIRYHHGTIGDGIGRMPTFGVIECIAKNADHSNFLLLYRLRCCEGYIPNTIDVPHINIDDYRFVMPPSDIINPNDPDWPYDPPDEDGEDPETDALLWALVFGGRW